MNQSTRLTELLGIKYPIIQGPFGGGLSSTRLAALVSNAGGLGSYGAESLPPDEIRLMVDEMRSLTGKPFAVNLWIPLGKPASLTPDDFKRTQSLLMGYFLELGINPPVRPQSFAQNFQLQIEALLESRPPIFSFVYGVPDSWILDECRSRGIRTMGTATTADEAAVLEEAGVDCIVASGCEAGGHKGAFLKPPESDLMGTFSLVPQVADRVKIPVVAAGGIADGRGIKAALALGAAGVQIGTAFLACQESGASPEYRQKLFGIERKETVLTRVFTGRLARSLRNRYSDEMGLKESVLPGYPIQGWFTASLKQACIKQGRTDLVSLWAGQSAPLVKFSNAEELFTDLVRTAFA